MEVFQHAPYPVYFLRLIDTDEVIPTECLEDILDILRLPVFSDTGGLCIIVDRPFGAIVEDLLQYSRLSDLTRTIEDQRLASPECL